VCIIQLIDYPEGVCVVQLIDYPEGVCIVQLTQSEGLWCNNNDGVNCGDAQIC